MDKHLKYINVQNIHKDLDRRTLVVTNTVGTVETCSSVQRDTVI
jgi:hypothetical protein